MSKAGEAAYKAYPYNGDYRGQGDSNSKFREACIKGYHQAEKDLELTIDDIMKLDALLIEMWNRPSNEDGYQEVLKRFKTEK